MKEKNEKKEKLDVKKKRKAKKSNFPLIEEIKQSWNKMRVKSMPVEEKRVIIDTMLKKLLGNIVSISLRHDASRVIQSIIQFGTVEQRGKVLQELAPKLAELAKTPYGHFTGLKAISTCTESTEQRKIISGLKSHFVSLGTNVIGARLVESILQTYPHSMTRELKAEFYGHKFTLLCPESPKNLHALIEALPAKASAILDHMKDLIHRFLDKGLLSFTYVHILLWEYIRELTCLPAKSQKIMADLITAFADNILPLLTTKPGAKSACIIISYSSAKERKRFIKAMKGHVMELAMHHASHLPLMRLVEVTDDTVNIQKSLFDEIISTKAIEKYSAAGELVSKPYPPMIVLAMDPYGSKFLQHLLRPSSDHHHLMPDEAPLFMNDPNVISSKKSSETRRKENLVYLKQLMIYQCTRYASDLVRSRTGSSILDITYKVFSSHQVIDAIARVFCNLPLEDIQEPENMITGDEAEGNEEEEDKEIDAADEQDDENVDGNNTSNIDFWTNDENENEEATAECVVDIEGNDSNPLPIHEDPVAHLLLKSIVQFEALLFSPQASSIDPSLFDGAPSIDESFSMTLLQYLSNDLELLSNWISCNRSCLALADIWKVNHEQIHQKMLEMIDASHIKALKESAAKIQGAKILIDILSARIAHDEPSKQKSNKKIRSK